MVVVGVVAGLSSPSDLANNTQHAEWKDMFSASAGVVAALVIALLVEARTPLGRGGGLAVRVATTSAALLLGVAGIASVVALSPSLPSFAYQTLLGLAIGGVVGGFIAVVMIGINAALGTLRRIDEASLEKLKELGDPSAADELLRDLPL